MFDFDKINGNIKVRISGKDDYYQPYGQKVKQKIKPGLIILEDQEKIFAVVGYKDSIETKIDLTTSSILVVTWGEKDSKIDKVLYDCANMLTQYN